MAYRGYIFSRNFMEERVPQHVQNLVIRDYCRVKNLNYLLHVTEYGAENCYIVFHQILDELDNIDGIVMYSLFQLPLDKSKRLGIYDKILRQKKSIHFAVERLSLFNAQSIERIENIWDVKQTIENCPKIVEGLSNG